MSKSKPQARNVAQQQAAPSRKGTKQEKLITMLRRKEGVTIEQMARALAWQTHTVHGVLSATIRKRLGLKIVSAASSGGKRTYRIAEVQ
jgi:hypothetical protein